MKKENISLLREHSRKLIRELGILQLSNTKKPPQNWHALIEIAKSNHLTTTELAHLLLLSTSATSRIVKSLIDEKLVKTEGGLDKREKFLKVTEAGKKQIAYMDEFSNIRIRGAFDLLEPADQIQIIDSIQKYANALEQSRRLREEVKVLTISTSRTLRKQIISMIENIQKNEFLIPITDEINACILKAEEDFYFNNSYNFWYAVDHSGNIIGSIGLKKIDAKNGEIKKFFVNSNYRGKGVAQKLLDILIKSAVKHHFQYLYLGTVNTLERAQRFYEKYGFAIIEKNELPKKFVVCPVDNIFFKGELKEIRSSDL